VTADEQGRRSLHPLRINASVATGLAGLSLLTSLLGLVAMQLFAVADRRHELGVRLALGAQRAQLARLVVGEALRLAVLGALLGIGGALGFTRLLGSRVYGLEGGAAWAYVAVPLGLLLAIVVASWLPALQAMRTDPVASLTPR
jgi:putative ABC transport system permease protein